MKRPKVNYLCIGAQKAGSSVLRHYLSQNDEIYIKMQEIHFFDKEKFSKSDYDKYEEKFNSKEEKMIGEKTPNYGYLPLCINRIFNYNPDMKLIYILREPISRAYSGFNMYVDKRKNIWKKNYYNYNNIYNIFEKEEKDMQKIFNIKSVEIKHRKDTKKIDFNGIDKISKNARKILKDYLIKDYKCIDKLYEMELISKEQYDILSQ